MQTTNTQEVTVNKKNDGVQNFEHDFNSNKNVRYNMLLIANYMAFVSCK